MTPDEVLRKYISNPAVRAKVEAAVGEKVAQAIEADLPPGHVREISMADAYQADQILYYARRAREVTGGVA